MGSCIICGIDADGLICSSHEEDVCFEFEGTDPEQLTPGRFYRGTVDGFADFGVFIDIGEGVTGLLHTSELDRRLESLDWDPGEPVFVQVKNVRDNGNVDLGWSIRQRPAEFRGSLVQTPEGDRLPEGELSADSADESAPEPTDEPEAVVTATQGGGGTVTADEPEAEPASPTASEDEPGERFQRSTVDELADQVGSLVRLEGRVVDIRQTGGPTLFDIRDETGVVECAAFESAGVRAYPDVDEGDIVRLDGEVEERRGSIQVETEALSVLVEDEATAVTERLEASLDRRAEPTLTEPLVDLPAIDGLEDDLRAVATTIRRAVFANRPVVVRHSATVDGYLGAAALEHAVLPLVRAEHDAADAEYHYIERRPLDGRVYDLRDALRDVSSMRDAEERHNEPTPLFVFIDAGGTDDSVPGLELLDVYDAETVFIDSVPPDGSALELAGPVVNPHRDDGEPAGTLSTTAIACEVAVLVNDEVGADLRHLPATSYWTEPPQAYVELAREAGYDDETLDTLRKAIALEAFYQAYDAKRELVADLLFGDRDLADHAGDQFDERIERELRTVESHLDRLTVDGATVGVLDTDAYTHRSEFPPVELTLKVLATRHGELDAIVGIDEDRLRVRSARPIDMRAIATQVADAVPEAGVQSHGGFAGHLAFLSGRRDDVIDEAIRAVAERL